VVADISADGGQETATTITEAGSALTTYGRTSGAYNSARGLRRRAARVTYSQEAGDQALA
jgi:hypothetical protein